MKPKIILSESASKELKRLDMSQSKRIFEGVSQLIENSDQRVIKLAGTPYFRLRAWNYRLIFDIHKDMLRVLVLKIGHKKRMNKKGLAPNLS